jgi:hypothetical protein
MTTTREDLISFIAAFWTSVGRDELKVYQRIHEYFRILSVRAADLTVSNDIPAKREQRPRGAFSPARRSLWLNRKALNQWFGKDARADANGVYAFYDDKDFGRLVAAHLNQPTKYEAAQTLAACGALDPSCVLIHGVDDGVLWLGARTLNEIVDTMTAHPDVFPRGPIEEIDENLVLGLTALQRAFLLQQRVEHNSSRRGTPPVLDVPPSPTASSSKRSSKSVARVESLEPTTTHAISPADWAVRLHDEAARLGMSLARSASDLDHRLPVKSIGPLISHPALPAALPLSGVVHLHGRHGSGRTSALHLLLKRLGRLAIVIDRSYRPDQRALIDEVSATHQDAVLVIDDLDKHHDPLPWQDHLLTIVTYEPSAAARLRDRYPPAFTTPITDVDLDAASNEAMVTFFHDIIEAAAPLLTITLQPAQSALDALKPLHPTITQEEIDQMRWGKAILPDMATLVAQRVAAWDSLPATLLAFLRSQAGTRLHHGAFHPPTESRAREYRRLSAQERAIVNTLAMLCLLQINGVGEPFLRTCTAPFATLGPDEFHVLLGRLMEQGWCRRTASRITGARANLDPAALGLWADIKTSDSVVRFAEWVLQHEDVLGKELRETRLLRLLERYIEDDAKVEAEALATYWADGDRTPMAAFAASLLATHGDEEQIRTYRAIAAPYREAFRGDAAALAKVRNDAGFKAIYTFVSTWLAQHMSEPDHVRGTQ